MAKMKGIDISEHNTGLNYTMISRQIDFVIIREGCRTRCDKLFHTHVNAFRALGTSIPAVYHFIYATTPEMAKKEAESAIKNVVDAGLSKDTFIWCDFEYDTVDKAKEEGIILTPSQCNLFTRIFCDAIIEAGYPTGIYTNKDFYVNWYYPETLAKYPLWLADYSGDPDYPCLVQQYTKDGRLEGCSDTFDMDYWYNGGTMAKITANDAINVFKGWIGRNEADNSHRAIIDIYNSYTPRARGYKVQYSDQWCDTAVSAVFIALNAVDAIGGTECGVEEHVKLFKKAGIWYEDGVITPKPGDLIVYNWNEYSQPNDGYSDHIGMVEKVSGNTIITIEGNYHDSVARRQISIGNGYIRGYARPKYKESSDVEISDGVSDQKKETVEIVLDEVSYGSTGSSVKLLQKLLKEDGYKGADWETLDIDGEAGENTIYALKRYQSNNGLDVDGICGKNTWSSLIY